MTHLSSFSSLLNRSGPSLSTRQQYVYLKIDRVFSSSPTFLQSAAWTCPVPSISSCLIGSCSGSIPPWAIMMTFSLMGTHCETPFISSNSQGTMQPHGSPVIHLCFLPCTHTSREWLCQMAWWQALHHSLMTNWSGNLTKTVKWSVACICFRDVKHSDHYDLDELWLIWVTFFLIDWSRTPLLWAVFLRLFPCAIAVQIKWVKAWDVIKGSVLLKDNFLKNSIIMPFLQIKRSMSKYFFNSWINEKVNKILEIVQIRI